MSIKDKAKPQKVLLSVMSEKGQFERHLSDGLELAVADKVHHDLILFRYVAIGSRPSTIEGAASRGFMIYTRLFPDIVTPKAYVVGRFAWVNG